MDDVLATLNAANVQLKY
jgi:hypothetical protein